MARTRSSPKSDLVRQYLATHPAATTSQVVADLKAQGISESLVKLVRQRAGRKGKRSAKKRPGRKPAARTAKPATAFASGTKAEAIRTVAKSLPKPVRPRDVIAVLRENGVTASSAQVSTVLLAMGMKKRKRRRRKMAAAGSANNSASLNINDLVMAKKLVGQVGSVEKVKEALAALARLG